MKLKITIVMLLLMAVLQGCLKDNFDLEKIKKEWNPTFAVPIIHARLGVYDILANADTSDLVVVDPVEGFIALVYKGELASFYARDIVKLPDQQGDYQLGLTVPQISGFQTQGTYSRTETVSHVYAAEGQVQIDSILFKSGAFIFQILSTLPCQGSITLSIPTLVKNNQPYQKIIPLVPNQTLIENINLTGYKMAMSKYPGDYNKFEIIYTTNLTYGGEQINSNQKVSINWNTSSWEFAGLFGYFGQAQVGLDQDSVPLRIFNNSTGGYFALTDPKINLIIDNSFGFPVQIKFNNLESLNEFTGISSQLLYSSFPNPFNIASPLISEIGKSKRTNLMINKTNSNVDSLITPTPKTIIYEMAALGNYNNPPSIAARNFLTDNSRFTISTELELPLEGFAYGFSIIDTLAFQFSEDKPELIEWVDFRINVENGFPVDVRMQLVFLDQEYQVLDSLMAGGIDNVIKSGLVNSSGRVTNSSNKITDVKIDQTRVDVLNKAKFIIVKGTSNTWKASASNLQNQVVKIYEDYKLEVRVGMKISLRPGALLN
jgi:hypothetical protein